MTGNATLPIEHLSSWRAVFATGDHGSFNTIELEQLFAGLRVQLRGPTVCAAARLMREIERVATRRYARGHIASKYRTLQPNLSTEQYEVMWELAFRAGVYFMKRQIPAFAFAGQVRELQSSWHAFSQSTTSLLRTPY